MLRKWLPIRSLKLAMLVVTVLALAIAIAIENPTFDASLNWLLLTFMLIAGARMLAERPPRRTFWVGFMVFASLFLYLERSYLDHAALYSIYSPAMPAGQAINRHEFGEVITDTMGQPAIIAERNVRFFPSPPAIMDAPPPPAKYQMLSLQIAAQESQQAHRRAFPIVVIAIGFLGGYLSQSMLRAKSQASRMA